MAEYANIVKYARRSRREAAILTTRGCPFDCNFCYHIFGRGVRYRSVDSVLREIEYLKNEYGVGSLLFGDECITARKSFMMELCRQMIDRKLDLEWICYSRVDTLDEESLPLMAQAGCHLIGFGLESGSQTILNAMNKKTTTAKMATAIQLARRYINHVSATLIFGYPGETDETIRETLQFCADNQIRPTLFYLQPYPGTTVFNQNLDKIVQRMGGLPAFFSELGDAGNFVINLTQWSDAEAIMKWQRTDLSLSLLAQSGWNAGVKNEVLRMV